MLKKTPKIGQLIRRLGYHSTDRFRPGGIYEVIGIEYRETFQDVIMFIGDNGDVHRIYDSYRRFYELVENQKNMSNQDFVSLLKEGVK